MKKFNVGIIGMGVGESHLSAYIKSSLVDEIKVYDFNKSKVKKLSKKYPKVIFTKKEKEITEDKRINIVSIASYDNFHAKQILVCLRNNKHVFVEKPLCLFHSEMVKIYKAFKKKKLKLSSNLVLRTSPLFNKLKNDIHRNNFGKIYYLEADYLWGRTHKFFGWRSKMKYYSKIYGAAVHMIDLLIWMIKEKPKEVFATGNKIATKSTRLRFNSFVNLNLIFSNGLIAKVTGNGPCVYPHFHSLKIFGTKKTFSHDYGSSFFVKKGKKIKTSRIKVGKYLYPAKNKRINIIKSFLDSIKKNKKSMIVNSKEVFDVMSICFAAEKSMITGKKVKIKYLD